MKDQNVISIKDLPCSNLFDAWLAQTKDPTPGGAWKEQQRSIDEYDLALSGSIEMLKRQKKTIEDLKVFTEKLLMDITTLEQENMKHTGKLKVFK